MSKIKDIKKDIRYLCEQLIIDSLEVAEVAVENDKPKVLSLISEISVFHNDLIARANHPNGKENPKLVKEYFKNIGNDLLAGCNKFYEKLDKLIPSGQ
jgi:hypothetical protein